MVGYVIYIDGFIDLAKARSHKMSRTMGFDKFISKIGGGEFSSYIKFMRA